LHFWQYERGVWVIQQSLLHSARPCSCMAVLQLLKLLLQFRNWDYFFNRNLFPSDALKKTTKDAAVEHIR
jgi:hypothetical protein